MSAVTRARTRYGTSPWDAALPQTKRPDHPRLRGDQKTRVVIIGGGLTGCATAYACAAAGLRPMLIEGARLGQGSSGRSAGLVLSEPGPSFRDVASAHGLRSARHVFELWRQGAVDAAALLKRLGMGRGLAAREHVTLATPGELTSLEREHEARAAAGFGQVWMSAKQVKVMAALDAAAGMRVRGGFSLDPATVTIGLAGAAAKRGATVFERTLVTKVRVGQNGVELLTEGGRVRAETVIVATGSATAEFQPLRRHFTRRETYLALSAPVTASMRKSLSKPGVALSAYSPTRRLVTWTPDGRLLVVGADQNETPARTREAVLVQRTGQLMYETLMMFPSIAGLQPEYGWQAAYGETADGLMYVGAHRNYPHHLFALGGSSTSVTGSFVAARVIARALLGDVQKSDAVLGWTR
jgi:glycine/D-amino acid oxidase-like deaminating enzyme